MSYDCQILLCSNLKELPWLNACLRSVQRFWRGPIAPIVVITPDCRRSLPSILSELHAYVVFKEEELHDYIRLTADSYLSAPMVLLMNVRELFTSSCDQTNFSDFMHRPTVAIEKYSTDLCRPEGIDNNCIQNRRWIIDDLLGFLPEYEFTGCNPVIFYRHSIRRLREAIEQKTKRPVMDLVRSYYPPYFSSASVMGAYCYEKEKSSYDWVPFKGSPARPVKEFWGVRDATKGEDLQEITGILSQ